MKRRPALQFKISLLEIKPEIWRKIQVSDLYSFWDLHVAIQDAMGWWDYHLHQFETYNPVTSKKEKIGIPEDVYGEDPMGDETLPGWELKIRDYFNESNPKMLYLYDFGDGWEHVIEFEGEVAKKPTGKYPRCVGGQRTCPPEDVGGLGGYERHCEIMANPTHEDYEDTFRWRGPYDPEDFYPEDVVFSNPSQRWKKAFNS